MSGSLFLKNCCIANLCEQCHFPSVSKACSPFLDAVSCEVGFVYLSLNFNFGLRSILYVQFKPTQSIDDKCKESFFNISKLQDWIPNSTLGAFERSASEHALMAFLE